MDKARDVRRGATRFKHSRHKLHSGLKGIGEDFELSEKSRREKLRKLSAVVGRSSSSFEDCEMGSDREEEDELRSTVGTTSKRFKLSQKFLDDCNRVGHASVPRRLRSAMKKRSPNSISPPLPDSKKLNCSKFDAIKKSKSNMKQRRADKCPKQTVSVPITKDEEEVADTLYALAGMFFNTNNNANDKPKKNHESSKAKPSDLQQSKGSHKPTLEEENIRSSSVERLAEIVKVESWNEPNITIDGPNLPHSKKLHLPPKDSAPQVDLNASSSLPAKTEETGDVKPTCSSVKFRIPSDAGLKQAQQKEASFLDRKPETAFGMATPIVSQMEPQHTVEECKKSGLAMWPGLPSTVSKGARVDDRCLPPSAAKMPAWLDVASRSSSVQSDSFGKFITIQISKVTSDRRFFRRCATHVYISRLIQALRMSENKDRFSPPQGQVRPHERLKQGVFPPINNFVGVENGVKEHVSASFIDGVVAKQNPKGAKTGVLQQKLHQDHPLSAVSPAVSTWRKQNFDLYLSLARGGGIEASDSFGRARNGCEPMSQLQNPYLPSLAQHQFGMPFSLPQSYYNSSACGDHRSSAQQVHMQIPSYSSPFYEASQTALAKHQQQQQQPQQRLWGAQYRPEDAPKTTIQFLGLQNGLTAQLQQQHPMSVAPSPFPPSKVMRQDHHLPPVYEEPGGGFRTSALPLQLLCSERL
ncbi:uncharacterized protein LOC21399121 isoform X3 [Morus notabilis]|uniref:uncharacterized protein LOC21399121 isoform X3 n=1 Tax=Morus notabilis TaxID=981085 RepID=UPI000CED2122|nr:uncharacterized protein LOC21399121 isoform X3 [Morus notabilis]